MNGELTVESVPGNGATFILTLKGVKTINEGKKSRNESISGSNHAYSFIKSSVLIADDIESNRLMLKEHLVNAGLEVFEVENGEVALVEAVEKKPQMIIMDIRMPKLSGIEAMKRLRNLDEFKTTPIIALSASNYLDEIDKNGPDSFTEYISKPVDVDKLMNVLERYIPKQTKNTKVAKRNSKEKFSITPELKEVFRREFEQKIENFSGAIKMQRIRALIGELHLFSNEYKSKEIDMIAVKLEKAVEAYDIEKIKSLLKKCNEFCK
jgi:CheY-like chemotaxis protein